MCESAFAVVTVATICVLVSCSRGREEVAITAAESDGTTVSMAIAACDANPRAEVQESEESVTITVTADRPGPDREDCGGGLTVDLSEPLGQRSLIDGSNDEPVQVNVDAPSD